MIIILFILYYIYFYKMTIITLSKSFDFDFVIMCGKEPRNLRKKKLIDAIHRSKAYLLCYKQTRAKRWKYCKILDRFKRGEREREIQIRGRSNYCIDYCCYIFLLLYCYIISLLFLFPYFPISLFPYLYIYILIIKSNFSLCFFVCLFVLYLKYCSFGCCFILWVNLFYLTSIPFRIHRQKTG